MRDTSARRMMELVKFDMQLMENPELNRTQRDLRKAHWIDAACVGHSAPTG
jgi:hypothetical protein